MLFGIRGAEAERDAQAALTAWVEAVVRGREDGAVPRSPSVPLELTQGPFDLAAARRAGVTRAQLLGPQWRRIGPETYVHKDVAESFLMKLKAASLRLPSDAAFSGPTGAFLHGLDGRCNVIEATIPSPTNISRRRGITIRRRRLSPDEVVVRHGLRVTSALRTVRDLVVRLDLVEAVVVLDAALHNKLIRLEDVPRYREYVEPATESHMETRLRMLLVLAGLPRPEVQVPLFDQSGAFLGRADLYYPDHRLVIEYDGATHKESLTADSKRQNLLIDAGFRVLRFTGGNLASAVRLVRRALSQQATSAAGTEPPPTPPPRPARSAPRPGPAGPRAA